MRPSSSKIIVVLLLLVTSAAANATIIRWKQLQPGLEYTRLQPDVRRTWAGIHVFRVDLKHYRLSLAFAADNKTQKVDTVRSLSKRHDALIGINGGFFSPELKPLGLRVKDGKIKNPLKSISWWGIFMAQGNYAQIVSLRAYQFNKQTSFAVQGGPRLIINGRVPSLKPGYAERTAVGLTRQGQLIIVVTENFPVTTLYLAEIMRGSVAEGGLGCYNALNLDGGTSSQLYARIGEFQVNVPGFKQVTDAVLVLAKQ